MATLDHLVDTLFRLPDADLALLYDLCAKSVERARQTGYPAIADWFDALGALLGLEIDRRAGNLDARNLTPPSPGDLLIGRAATLADDELKTIGVNLYSALFGLAKCPRGDFIHAAIGLLYTEGTQRLALQ